VRLLQIIKDMRFSQEDVSPVKLFIHLISNAKGPSAKKEDLFNFYCDFWHRCSSASLAYLLTQPQECLFSSAGEKINIKNIYMLGVSNTRVV